MTNDELIALAEQCNKALLEEYTLFGWAEDAPQIKPGDVRAILPVLVTQSESVAPKQDSAPAEIFNPTAYIESVFREKEPQTEPQTEPEERAAQPQPDPKPHGSTGKRRPMSDEHRAAISAAAKARHEKRKAKSEPPAPVTVEPPLAGTNGYKVKRIPRIDTQAVRVAMIVMSGKDGFLPTQEQWNSQKAAHLPDWDTIMLAMGFKYPASLANWCKLKLRKFEETV